MFDNKEQREALKVILRMGQVQKTCNEQPCRAQGGNGKRARSLRG